MAESNESDNTGNEGRRKEYRLTNRERNFILNGESGTDRPSRLMNNIRDKRDHLPDRFHELFLDIEHMESGDYFDPREWEHGWKQLFGVGSTENINTEFVRFGRKLGVMTRRLTLYPHNSSETEIWADFIFGFIDGLCFHTWDEHPRYRDESLKSILEKVKRRSDDVFEERASEEEEWFSQWKDRQLAEEKTIQQITEILEEEDIDQPRSLALSVYSLLRDKSHESDLDEITRTEVIDIVETNELILRRKLQTTIANDIGKLESHKWGDLSALEFLEHVPHTVESASSRTIASELGSPQKYLSNVVKLGLFLVGEEQIDGDVWEGPEIIKSVGAKDTYGNREWRLTDYGRALRAIHLDRTHSVRSLSDDQFTQEHFEHALRDPDIREYLE